MKPTVGRIVHYYETDDDSAFDPIAAIITGIGPFEKFVSLCVFKWDDSIGFRNGVHYAERPTAGHWSWPPRS